jgi:hypothetical protein
VDFVGDNDDEDEVEVDKAKAFTAGEATFAMMHKKPARVNTIGLYH